MYQTMESYFICYRLLAGRYMMKKYPQLGELLGCMDPTLCGDGYPVAHCYIADWQTALAGCEVDRTNIFDCISQFLSYLEKLEPDYYDFSELRQYIAAHKDTVDPAVIKDAEAFADELYAQFHYPDHVVVSLTAHRPPTGMYRKMEAYIIAYALLLECYSQQQEDSLGDMLGSMNPALGDLLPNLCIGGMPISNDCIDYWTEMTQDKPLDAANIIPHVFTYLEYLEQAEPGYYDFPETKAYILAHRDALNIRKAEAYARELYRRHCYPD